MSPIRRVGFIGLGRMGYPMAAHLVAAGFDLTVYDVRRQIVDAFVSEHGGTAASDLLGAGTRAEALVTMLPTGVHVHQAIFGDGSSEGAVPALAPGAVVIDMGSSDPLQTRALGERLRERGIHLVDAPVAGGAVFARDGTLDVMVGGDAGVIARVRPVLEAVGRRVHECGGLGNAHAMKALSNYVNAAVMATLVEALTVGRRLGLEVGVMVESLAAATTRRNHPLEKKVLPQMLTRRFAHGAALGLMGKDVRTALASAKGCGAWAPMAERCSELWDEAEALLGFDADQTEILRLWEERTGVRVEQEGHE